VGVPAAGAAVGLPERGCPDELGLGAGVGSEREGASTWVLGGAVELGGEVATPGTVALGVADGAAPGAAAPGAAPAPDVPPAVCASA